MKKEIKIIAIICFILIMSALATALISDAIVVGQAILGFVLALIISVVVFFFAIICMFISIILVFGIYLLGDRGFWPLDWAKNAFDEVMRDYEVTQAQINTLITIRIVLLAICLVVFILAIIVVSHVKKIKKQDKTINRKPTAGFGTASLVLSILGIIASGCMLVIFNFIL